MIVVGKAGVAINANQVLFGIIKHGPFEGVQTSGRVFASPVTVMMVMMLLRMPKLPSFQLMIFC